MIVQDKYNR